MHHALRWVGITVVLGGMLLASPLVAAGQEVVHVTELGPGEHPNGTLTDYPSDVCPWTGLQHLKVSDRACGHKYEGDTGLLIPLGP
jgi:hypothetical protein